MSQENKNRAKIGVEPRTRLYLIERVGSEWWLWTAANKDYTLGTRLVLHDNGKVENVTAFEEGYEDSFVVKPEDE